jgi:hypothetical protein
MGVEHRLPGVGPGVEDQPVAVVPGVGRHAVGRAHEGGDRGRRLLGQRRSVGDVPTRYDEHVERRLGVEVAERHHVVVRQHDLGRDLTGDDPAEHALIPHGAHRVMKSAQPRA